MNLNTIKGSVWNPEENDYTSALTNAVERTLQSKFEDIVSVKDFGAVGDGINDDTTAIQNALNSGNAIFFPDGTYILNTQLTVTNRAVRLEGGGINVSILKWVTGSVSTGLKVTQNSDQFTTTINNLSFHTELVNSGTAIEIDNSAQISGGVIQDRLKPRAVLQNIEYRGANSPSVDGWNIGVSFVNVIHTRLLFNFFVGNFSGSQDNIQSESAFSYAGAGFPTNHNIIGCNAFYALRAVKIRNKVEGVQITNCSLVAVTTAVDWNADSLEPPRLSMVNSHTNVYSTGVIAQKLSQAVISNVLFYSRADATGATTHINFDADVEFCTITACTFVNNNAFNNTAIILNGATVKNNIVNGCLFQTGTTGVQLNAGTFNNLIINNFLRDSLTNKVIDNSGTTRNFISVIELATIPVLENNIYTENRNSLSSGNRDTVFDLLSDDVNTDFSARLIRESGENGVLTLRNRGTGTIRLAQQNIVRFELGENGFEINSGASGDRASLIDFRSDDVNADFSLRIIRSAGANADAQIDNKGTGQIVFRTNNTSRFQILGTENTLQFVNNNVKITTGTGSPEGVVVAPVGSTYHRDDGGAGTSFYVKESGIGNTGWVAK